MDALASDYLPCAMLGAIAVLVRTGMADLPGAARLVSTGSAAVAGLAGAGALAPGARADLLLVDVAGPWPRVAMTPAGR